MTICFRRPVIDLPRAFATLRAHFSLLLLAAALSELLNPLSTALLADFDAINSGGRVLSVFALILGALLTVVGLVIVQAFVFISVENQRLGQPCSIAASWLRVRERAWEMAVALIGFFAFVLLGVFMFVLPVFYFMAKFSFASYVAVSSSRELARTPLESSSRLTQGRMKPLVFLMVSYAAISFLVAWASGGLTGSISWENALAWFPVNALLFGLWTSLIAVATDNAIADGLPEAKP